SFRRWRSATRDTYTTAGVETPFRLDVPGDVRVRGRIDRLEATREDTVIAVDVKTAATAVRKATAQDHPQLALYQLAVGSGAVEPAADPGPGGGLLLALGGREGRLPGARGPDAAGAEAARGPEGGVGGREGRLPVEREQDPVGPESARDLEERVRVAGESTLGPAYRARVGEWCVHCEVRSSCPAQPEGRQVTG